MIVLVDHSPYFEIVIQSLHEVLAELGIPHRVWKDCRNDDSLYILCTVHENRPLPNRYIAYNWEQLTTDKVWSPSLFDKFRKAHAVWDYSQKNAQYLSTKGIHAIHVPLGFAKCMQFPHSHVPRFDVSFLGSMNERRYERITPLLKYFQKKPDKLFLSNSCFGEDVGRVYKSSLVGINMHFYGGETILEVLRVLPMLANGMMVVSETSDDEWYQRTFSECIQWIGPDKNDLVRKVIQVLIMDKKERESYLEKVRDYLTTKCQFVTFVNRPEVLQTLTYLRNRENGNRL